MGGWTWGHGFRGHGSTGSHTQTNNTPLGLDMGAWGLGDMGFRGHGSTGSNNTPLGFDMGAWGHGDMGRDMGTGDMGTGDMVLLDHIPKQTTHL